MKCSKCGQRMIRVDMETWTCTNKRCEEYKGKSLK